MSSKKEAVKKPTGTAVTTAAAAKPAKKPAAAAAAAAPQENYLPHKLASLVPGEMNSDEFEALCISIKEDKQRHPIILYQGAILDGRQRYRACKKLGIKPIYSQFSLDNTGADDKDAAAFVLDNNLHRRTLCSMQKALVAAHMHLESNATQKDAAARVGVGVATVNLAVRLINSKNTPLIKRAENGDATRAEIDELLFDRAAAAAVQSTADMVALGADNDEGDEGEAMRKAPGNVVAFPSGNGDKLPTVGTKPTHPERRAQQTPASLAVQRFKALDDKGRAAFVTMAWTWLEPALRNAGKLPAAAPSKSKKKAA